MNTGNMIRSLAVAACVLTLSACDESKTSNKEQNQPSAEQAEVLKYNAYVEVANSFQRSYAKELATFQSYVQPVLDGKDKNDNLFYSTNNLDRLKNALAKAREMKPDIAELDGSADAYRDAAEKAEPLDRDMGNYISAKTYLSDKGAHGREIRPAFIAAMETLAAAQGNFISAIDAKDRARIKTEFESVQKDTRDYFRIGMIYHIKESMDAADGFLQGKGLGDRKDALKTSLDQFNTMATGYDAKVREKNNAGCSSMMLNVNAYLATGRQIILRTENGRYQEDKKAQFQMMSAERQDATQLLQDYNDVINAINFNKC